MWGHSRSPRRLPPGRRNPSRRRLWLQFLVFLTFGLLLAGSVFGWRMAYATERLNPSEAGAGQLLLRTETGGYQAAVALYSNARFQISGMIAQVEVGQEFRNDDGAWREAVYVFPLPEQAAVRALRIRIGERVIEGEIHERQRARKIYTEAKSAGIKAGLVEQERPNLFTTSVANIAPGETVIVELEYVQTVTYDAGEFSLRFPMTITPRYIPGDPLTEENTQSVYTIGGDGWAVPTDQVPDAARITPYLNPLPASESRPVNQVTIDVSLAAGLPIVKPASPTHAICVVQEEQNYYIELAGGSVAMDRDFELRWRPETGHQPQAALFTEMVAGSHFALLMLVPPAHTTNDQLLPRDMVFVIDTSGSMGGVSIEQARQGLLLALDRLRPGDRFNIIEFNSMPNALYARSRPYSAQRLQEARRFVTGLQAHGGTEMRPALEMALNGEAAAGMLRQMIFLTDGAVGNEAALFRLIRERLGDSRLFTVGIGSAPNSHFMRKAAQFGRGTFTYIHSTSEVRQRMVALFAKLESPVAGDLRVDWSDGMEVLAYPSRPPDLYRGEPLLLAARVRDFSGAVVVNGRTAESAWRRELALHQHRQSPGIAGVWARARIAELLDQKTAGRPEGEVRDEVLETALTHRLVSPYTSFVAVERRLSRPTDAVLEKSSVANARPHGQSDQPYAWPPTATDSRWKLLIGALLLLAAGWLRRERRHAQ